MLELRALDDERLLLSGVDAAVAFCLRRVPDVLAQRGSIGVRERLHPDAIPGDAARNAEWHRLVDAELEHLFDAAQRTLEQDLERFDPGRGEIAFPASHLKAWMSAVNQARIVLAEQHGFRAEDLEQDEFAAGSAHDTALLQVQLLGYVMQVLVEYAMEGT